MPPPLLAVLPLRVELMIESGPEKFDRAAAPLTAPLAELPLKLEPVMVAAVSCKTKTPPPSGAEFPVKVEPEIVAVSSCESMPPPFWAELFVNVVLLTSKFS